MIFKLDEENLVLTYISQGEFDIKSSKIVELEQYNVEINQETEEEIKTLTGLVPIDFQENFKIYKYKYDGEKIVANENYVEPTPPDNGEQENPVDALGRQVTSLTIDNGNLKEQNKILGQSLAELKLEVAKLKGGEE